MKRRREFYKAHPAASTSLAPNVSREERGEMDEQELIIYTDDEHLSLSLEYYQQSIHIPKPKPTATLPRPVGNGDTASTSSSGSSSSSSSCSDSSSDSGSTAEGLGGNAGGDAAASAPGVSGNTSGSGTGVLPGAAKAAEGGGVGKAVVGDTRATVEGKSGVASEQSAQERLKAKMNVGNVGATTATTATTTTTLKPNGNVPINGKTRVNGDANGLSDEIVDKRYLRCPAAVSIGHIKKFIRHKFGLSLAYQIEVMYRGSEDELLPDDYTLMDVAYIYTWGRVGPMPLVYRVYQPVTRTMKRTLTDKNVPVIPEKVQKKPDPASDQKKKNNNNNTTAATGALQPKPKDGSLNQGSQENTSPSHTPIMPPGAAKSTTSSSSISTKPAAMVANRT